MSDISASVVLEANIKKCGVRLENNEWQAQRGNWDDEGEVTAVPSSANPKTVIKEVGEKAARIKLPADLSVRTALIYSGQLDPEIARSGFFHCKVTKWACKECGASFMEQ